MNGNFYGMVCACSSVCGAGVKTWLQCIWGCIHCGFAVVISDVDMDEDNELLGPKPYVENAAGIKPLE